MKKCLGKNYSIQSRALITNKKINRGGLNIANIVKTFLEPLFLHAYFSSFEKNFEVKTYVQENSTYDLPKNRNIKYR